MEICISKSEEMAEKFLPFFAPEIWGKQGRERERGMIEDRITDFSQSKVFKRVV